MGYVTRFASAAEENCAPALEDILGAGKTGRGIFKQKMICMILLKGPMTHLAKSLERYGVYVVKKEVDVPAGKRECQGKTPSVPFPS